MHLLESLLSPTAHRDFVRVLEILFKLFVFESGFTLTDIKISLSGVLWGDVRPDWKHIQYAISN